MVGLKHRKLQLRSMLRYRCIGALPPVTAIPHLDRKGGLATRTAFPPSQPLPSFCNTLPNLQCGAAEALWRHYHGSMDLVQSLALTHSPFRVAYILFIRILPVNSHVARATYVGRFSDSVWARCSGSLAPAPGSRRLTYLSRPGIPYICVIYLYAKSLLPSPVTAPGDGYLRITDLGDVDTEPLRSGLRRSLSLPGGPWPLLRRPSLSHILFR